MMRQIASMACGLALGLVLPGEGRAEQAVVVELYTSQGCSSCPPADVFFADLAADPSIIALSLHVDYWDYIGWEDSFADPRFTARQKAYARAEGSRTIYTPQLIVQGVDRVVGAEPAEVAALVAQHREVAPRVALEVTRSGDVVSIRAEADPPLETGARVQLVRYRPQETVTIERGENAGQTLTYHNIVTDWRPVADWPGVAPFEATAEVAGTEPVVVIVQGEGMAGILAAARVD